MATSTGYDMSLSNDERYKRAEKIIDAMKEKKDAFRPEYLFGALLKNNKEVFEVFVKYFLDDRLNVAEVKDEYHHFTVLHYAACYTTREDFLTLLFEKYKQDKVLYSIENKENKNVLQLLQQSGNAFKIALAERLKSY